MVIRIRLRALAFAGVQRSRSFGNERFSIFSSKSYSFTAGTTNKLCPIDKYDSQSRLQIILVSVQGMHEILAVIFYSIHHESVRVNNHPNSNNLMRKLYDPQYLAHDA